MAQPRRWVEEIVDVITELGGKASLPEIRQKVQARNIMDYKKSSIPRTLERYCRTSERWETGQDIFHSTNDQKKEKYGGLEKIKLMIMFHLSALLE